MKVLYVAAECKPFAKAGGVGDVTGELPPALKALGVDIEIVTPWYGVTSCRDAMRTDGWGVRWHGVMERVDVLTTALNGVPVTFLRNATFFETDYSKGGYPPPFASPHLFKKNYSAIYVESEPTLPYIDDAARFSFFSEACLELIERRRPDIVHVNDWVLGFLLGRMTMLRMPPKTALTIHNIAYQGNLGRDLIDAWPMDAMADDATIGPLFADPRRSWNSVNALRLGMETADVVNTVSPTYRKEITQPEDQSRYFEGGKGLDAVAARLDREGRLHGILNGFEYTTPADEENFAATLEAKARAKTALFGNVQSVDGCFFGFVGRAVEQKFKLLTELVDGKSVLEHILAIPHVNVAIVATGQREYEEFLWRLHRRSNVDVTIAFDRKKAHQISLGSDVFLMPSLFEPCGITQMESLSHATPPLVRWTGGLVDTVTPHTDPSGTGFGFDGSSRREILENLFAAAQEAVRMYVDRPATFRQLQRRGFAARFRWEDSAKRYLTAMYEPLVAGE
jgi:starch synthase